MAATLRIDILTNALKAKREMGQVEDQAGKLGGGLKKLGGVVAGAFAVGAIVGFGKEVYNAASSVQQSFGAVDSVFKKNSGEVKKWASSAAGDVGLAKSEYANLAALLGSQLTNMGRSTGDAAKQTDELIKMGADLAATYGGSVADAVSAVSSVLKGETDPIERYGISIKQADISARLASKGQADLEGTAKKSATATAALDLITRQASAAQGAFGREANTAAGQQERSRAQLENLKATIGSGLLPVMTTVFSFINNKAFPAVARLGKSLKRDFGDEAKAVGQFIKRDLIPAVSSIYDWFVVKIVPQLVKTVRPVVDGIGKAFKSLSKNFEGNNENLAKLGKFIKVTAELLAKLLPVIGKVIGTGIQILAKEIGFVVDVISTLVGWIDGAIQKIKDLGKAITDNPIAKGIGKVGGFIGGLFGAGPIAGRVGALSGPSASTDGVRRLATAADGGGGALFGSSGSRAPALFGSVDGRTFVNVNVTGALDPTAVARQISDVLRRYNVNVGRASTFAPATGWVG